jgi:hypothetical protein
MKKFLRGLGVTAVIIAIGGVAMSWMYTQNVSEELTRLRRESRSDIVYLRTRVRELESELTACLLNQLEPPSEAVDGEEAHPVEQDTPAPEAGTEAVTAPTHQAPETQTPTLDLPDSEATDAEYFLSEYQGVIGVFDNSGNLLRTINVFVMTLPEAERVSLEIGIPVFSWEELDSLLEQFE